MKPSRLQADLRIALLYALFGGIWILLSDRLLEALVKDTSTLSDLQTYKGWAFVTASALMIFLLLRRELALRSMAEEKYDASEERFRQLFEHSLDAILLSSPDGSIHAANPAACRLFQRTEAEIREIGRSGLVDLADSRLKAALEQRARTGSSKSELTFLRKDGSRFEGEVSSSIFRTRDGVERTSMIIRDITERAKAEETLRQSEERFAKAFRSSPVAIIISRVSDGKFIDMNQAACQIYGFDLDELIGHTSVELGIIDAAERLKIVEALQAQGELHNHEVIIHSRGAGDRHVLYSMELLTINGELCMLTAMIDITPRRQLEEDLRRAELQYRTLVEQVTPIIYMTGPEQYIGVTYVSPRITSLGFTQEEWVANPELWVRQLHPDDRERVLDQIEEIKKTGIVPQMEYRLMTRDGKVRWFLDEVMEVKDNDGNLVYRQGIMLDITDRKQAEQELRLSRDRLGDLSRQMARIQETERRAIGRELHDQIGQMLTAIKINLDLIPDLPPERAAKKMEQAQEIVADLLNRVSRLSLELRPPMLDDLGLIPALTWHIRHYQEQTGTRVVFQHSGVEGVRFDPEIETAVYRVAQEALTNVARHAQATGVRLQVHAGGGHVEVQIEDDGQGFDPEAALAMNRGFSGMRERINLLSGRFQAESQPGRGARVSFRIPLQQAAHD